jgi:SAM-dependent methyltransferase
VYKSSCNQASSPIQNLYFIDLVSPSVLSAVYGHSSVGMTEPSDGYMLGRGLGPSLRLVAQHWLWKNHYGWNLYPGTQTTQHKQQREQEERPQSETVADLATGNAIWLIDEAVAHPSNKYFGFDISTSQFPPQDTWPANVTLQHLDATAPVPPEHVGVFDAVHIRLLVPAVRANDPRPVLRNAIAMLKPGGMLQWSEIIPQCITLGRPGHVSAAQTIIATMRTRMGSPGGIDAHWISRLPSIFREEGLGGVECLRMGEPRQEMWMFWGEMCAGAMEEAAAALRMGTDSLVEMAKERQRGDFAFYEPQIVVGWKERRV